MFVDIGTARIYFDTVGSQLELEPESVTTRPILIVMHGGPGFDHTTLRPYFDRFADSHQVLYIDHRGNGRSSGDPETWTLAQWGDDVRLICDALGIEKPHVYGNSFGGMVAMSYASRHPEHPAKLILSSTAATMHLEETYAMMQKLGGDEARSIAEQFWTAPNPEVMADYMAVCMPLYNTTSGPEQMAARKRALRALRGDPALHPRGTARHGPARRARRYRVPDAGAGGRSAPDHACCLLPGDRVLHQAGARRIAGARSLRAWRSSRRSGGCGDGAASVYCRLGTTTGHPHDSHPQGIDLDRNSKWMSRNVPLL